jgi:hypothetical protein
MSKHYVNEIGTDFIIDCGVDLTNTTVQQIWYRKPDNSTIGSWSGSLYNSYSLLAKATGTYFVKYTLASGNLDTAGEWRFQAYIANSTGTWWGETVKEVICDKFE